MVACSSCAKQNVQCSTDRPCQRPRYSNGDSMKVAASPHANSEIQNQRAEKLEQEEKRDTENPVQLISSPGSCLTEKSMLIDGPSTLDATFPGETMFIESFDAFSRQIHGYQRLANYEKS